MKPPAFNMNADWSFETAGYQGQLCMYKRVPGYKIKHLCENLTVGLVYTCDLVWLQKLLLFQ